MPDKTHRMQALDGLWRAIRRFPHPNAVRVFGAGAAFGEGFILKQGIPAAMRATYSHSRAISAPGRSLHTTDQFE
jgi:hypothetical protein